MRRGDGGKAGGRASRRDSARRPVRIALWLAGALILVLALAQIFLPKLAADRISSRLGRYGEVRSVHVSAWPAIELLWGDADSVSVRAGSLRVSPAQTAKLLWEARGLDRLDLTAAGTREGPLALHDISLHKRGRTMHAQASVSSADVKAALPPGFDVQLLGSSDGQVLVRASGGLFGIGATVDAVAQASSGKLVVQPQGFLVEALKLTLFSDPHVYVEAVGASRSGGGYVLSIDARLR
jgi:LmeA-like phospholipid-binding